jgi:hypothetical protein
MILKLLHILDKAGEVIETFSFFFLSSEGEDCQDGKWGTRGLRNAKWLHFFESRRHTRAIQCYEKKRGKEGKEKERLQLNSPSTLFDTRSDFRWKRCQI